LRVVAGLIYPVMPETAATMQRHLGMDPETPFFHLEQLKRWKVLAPGTQLPKTVALFPRIENAGPAAAESPGGEEAPPAGGDIKPEISIEDFSRVDLRVATVLKAEKIPRAKKLLRLELDVGQKRTVVAGIAEHYPPEELVGKQVIIVANLKPAKLMGVVSNGMVLAAVASKRVVLAALDKPVEPGTPLR
jgi:methionyl-tRNA synthetase